MVSVGLCETIEEVPGNIHMCTPDVKSNTIVAWREMEGACCVCHHDENCLGTDYSSVEIVSVLKKLNCVCAHFHRSDKISFKMPCFYVSSNI